ncbi:MAG: ABC transporter ATP-binding protein [Leptolyngbya sp. PLA3]|nr:MAG: ABC transporter ATP-binding protein [Cyanobacteria bacterium CYA]MCE7968633.1 ABC transporter ATP-binding protein [Leptolyngbya sp. PL-A3]
MIFARSISKRFGSVDAVCELTFALQVGQIAGLLGPNGAGKSTTIRMITGFLAPDRGTVQVGGHDMLTDPQAARALIGYLPESCPIYPEMRAIDYLRYRARLFGLDRRAARRSADRCADRCRIGSMARKRVSALSKGYRQRVGLASTLLHDPAVLILDEPTNGLDPGQIREARSLIRELAENRTMLISSHILPEIERTCDRVLVIAGGRLCADGPPSDLLPTRGQRLHMECKVEPAHPVFVAIGNLPGVRIETATPLDDRWTGADLHLDEPGLRERIAGELNAHGVLVRELTLRRESLEDAFVRLADPEARA